ncbi:hypothetical protein C8R46DRAFT_1206525 [Mycena filopes]|nr:hypothetical protein C8R46DRAFT_1220248 [Mycena filopes]KAJ7186526.1 hypothetical protein C8R46DRAFT_1206525 [Mycena filopes]
MCKRSLSCRFLRHICPQSQRCVTARCSSRLPVDLARDFVGYAPALCLPTLFGAPLLSGPSKTTTTAASSTTTAARSPTTLLPTRTLICTPPLGTNTRSTFPASSTAPHAPSRHPATLPQSPRPHHFLDDDLDANLFDFDPTRSRSILAKTAPVDTGAVKRKHPNCASIPTYFALLQVD